MAKTNPPSEQQESYDYFSKEEERINEELAKNQSLFRSQVTLWSLGSFIAAMVGLGVIVFGFVMVLIGKNSSGWFVALAGGVEDAVAVLFYVNIDRFINPVSNDQATHIAIKRELLLIQVIKIADPENKKNFEGEVIKHFLEMAAVKQSPEKPQPPTRRGRGRPHSSP